MLRVRPWAPDAMEKTCSRSGRQSWCIKKARTRMLFIIIVITDRRLSISVCSVELIPIILLKSARGQGETLNSPTLQPMDWITGVLDRRAHAWHAQRRLASECAEKVPAGSMQHVSSRWGQSNLTFTLLFLQVFNPGEARDTNTWTGAKSSLPLVPSLRPAVWDLWKSAYQPRISLFIVIWSCLLFVNWFGSL